MDTLRVIGWRFWFTGGRVFDSTISLDALPRNEGLGVVQYYEHGYRDLLKGDWWTLTCGRWERTRIAEKRGEWSPRPEGNVVVQGIEINDDAWDKIAQQMWEAKTWL